MNEDFLPLFNSLLDLSKLHEVFGVNKESLIWLLSASIIFGIVCLTTYYYVYANKKEKDNWNKINYLEKVIISLIIGFITILTSLLIITSIELMLILTGSTPNDFVFQFGYLLPFILFYFGYKNHEKRSNFIKSYFHFCYLSFYNVLIITLFFSSMVFNNDIYLIMCAILIIIEFYMIEPF